MTGRQNYMYLLIFGYSNIRQRQMSTLHGKVSILNKLPFIYADIFKIESLLLVGKWVFKVLKN